ncbi:hypothetical protein ACN2C6_11320 [Caulobacter sp. ErkDOM-YI]|uniref:hypothetical protein n=1 Tax=unclassified Caulobacter TaxID=2648921 RepID=UPI003AF6CD21
MSTPEPASGVPVWARKRRKPGNPLIGVVVAPLFLLGVLTAGLAIQQKSFTGAGARMDGWIAIACHHVEAAVADLTGKPAKVAPPETMEETPAGKSGRIGG